MKPNKLWACILILAAGTYELPVHAQNTSAPVGKSGKRILGTWKDDSVHCKSMIERREGKYYQFLRECRDLKPSDEISTPLIQISSDSFREDVQPKKSWHYKIAASGDLEVRDREGIIRTLESIAPKTESQVAAQRKSQGISIGMTAQDVLQSSWGKPKKVNRTVTSSGTREQWIYGGGYIYIENGIVVAIQN